MHHWTRLCKYFGIALLIEALRLILYVCIGFGPERCRRQRTIDPLSKVPALAMTGHLGARPPRPMRRGQSGRHGLPSGSTLKVKYLVDLDPELLSLLHCTPHPFIFQRAHYLPYLALDHDDMRVHHSPGHVTFHPQPLCWLDQPVRP